MDLIKAQEDAVILKTKVRTSFLFSLFQQSLSYCSLRSLSLFQEAQTTCLKLTFLNKSIKKQTSNQSNSTQLEALQKEYDALAAKYTIASGQAVSDKRKD